MHCPSSQRSVYTEDVIKDKPRRLSFVYPPSPIYFVTCCTLHRRRLLANEHIHDLFSNYCISAEKFGVVVGRYVLMPDHLHLFVCGGPEFVLSVWIRGLKRAMRFPPKTWQPGFFDHVLRSDESYAHKWQYVQENPIRAGLVSNAEDWPFQGEISSLQP